MEAARSPRLAPYLVVNDARGLVKFIEGTLDGKLGYHHDRPDGTLMHAEVRIADSLVMVADSPSGRDVFPAMIHLYVTDADASFERALKAGASEVQKPATAPDGDRRGGVQDKWGNQWWFTSLRG